MLSLVDRLKEYYEAKHCDSTAGVGTRVGHLFKLFIEDICFVRYKEGTVCKCGKVILEARHMRSQQRRRFKARVEVTVEQPDAPSRLLKFYTIVCARSFKRASWAMELRISRLYPYASHVTVEFETEQFSDSLLYG